MDQTVSYMYNTHLYYNSFLPSAVCDLDELIEVTKTAKSIFALKRRLNSTLIDVPLFNLKGNIPCWTGNRLQHSKSPSLFEKIS